MNITYDPHPGTYIQLNLLTPFATIMVLDEDNSIITPEYIQYGLGGMDADVMLSYRLKLDYMALAFGEGGIPGQYQGNPDYAEGHIITKP